MTNEQAPLSEAELAELERVYVPAGHLKWTKGYAVGPSDQPGYSALQHGDDMLIYSCDGCDLVDEDDYPFAQSLAAIHNAFPRLLATIRQERERCAKVAETWADWTAHIGWDSEEYAAEDIAARIRSGQ